ncbi:hypothetical protein GALMADRAFT_252910 [Galerina marginata CBS 339.88]|uniref:DUF7330 domain-containing protein n=1 Tax=Galerina marginata (strain CBS 339.88) TaxID=685588 RepID=A0A067SP26_GALM3|nr:hypothetical protein GALMADRAFT_252910 [Galerina marginata CBS 339.88]
MILTPEDQPSKKITEANVSRVLVVQTDDPPPLYSPSDSQVASSSTRPETRNLPDIKPSNFVYLSRVNSSVKGTWVLDPSLAIPSAFLPPLAAGETEETRSNLSLDSKNGVINGEIYILPPSNQYLALSNRNRKQCVTIRARSWNGGVTTKIREVPPTGTEGARLPIRLYCSSFNGGVSVYLPRAFEGPIKVKTLNGSLRFSDAVKQLVTPFSEMDGMQRSFLGNFDAAKWETGAEWAGDELFAETKNGNVKIYFDDEADAPAKPRSGGFFGRIFNF